MRISDWSSDVCSSDLAQIGAGAPLKKRLWQAIIRRKVENQAVVLDRAQIEGGRTLRELTAPVRSGDPGNVQARAPHFYWQRLFQDLRRPDDADRRNSMLNSCHAVLRAGEHGGGPCRERVRRAE